MLGVEYFDLLQVDGKEVPVSTTYNHACGLLFFNKMNLLDSNDTLALVVDAKEFV